MPAPPLTRRAPYYVAPAVHAPTHATHAHDSIVDTSLPSPPCTAPKLHALSRARPRRVFVLRWRAAWQVHSPPPAPRAWRAISSTAHRARTQRRVPQPTTPTLTSSRGRRAISQPCAAASAARTVSYAPTSPRCEAAGVAPASRPIHATIPSPPPRGLLCIGDSAAAAATTWTQPTRHHNTPHRPAPFAAATVPAAPPRAPGAGGRWLLPAGARAPAAITTRSALYGAP